MILEKRVILGLILSLPAGVGITWLFVSYIKYITSIPLVLLFILLFYAVNFLVAYLIASFVNLFK